MTYATLFKHKYDLNQEIWFMKDNKPTLGFIKEVTCHYCVSILPYNKVKYVGYIIKLQSAGCTSFLHYNEKELFPTKESLLNSLR